jgi:hydrogenase maturation protease
MGASERLVIGLGNRLRGDDAIGLEVAEALAGAPGVRAIAHEGEPVDLLELWSGASEVAVVDAVAGERPGRIHRLSSAEAGAGAWRAAPASSHAIGLADVLELAAALGRLPGRLEVIGVEGDSFGTGTEPGARVREAGRRVAAELGASVASTPPSWSVPTDAGGGPRA